MRIIVSDSCALIDIKKGALLEDFLELPFEFIVPNILLADELLSFGKSETALMRRKMTVAELDGKQVTEIHRVQREHPALTVHDCAALLLAKTNSDAILLTGDRRLRTLAESAGVECHGILWVVDELSKAKLATRSRLLAALERWRSDILVRLPRTNLDRSIARYKKP